MSSPQQRGPERISRSDFGLLVAKHLALNPACIIPTSQRDVQLACPRPPDVSLDISAARRFGFAPLAPGPALARLQSVFSA